MMRVTQEGLDLIRRFEGFRGEAYRDAVGVWTIGYGHTTMAGPPRVTPGLRLSREEAAAILARDVEKFSVGVRQAVTVPLNEAQFSALVSFAYNVGLGALRSSSVLKAVNAGDFAAVPQRLALWVKAGGRALPGLVKRRAAEGALFSGGVSASEAPLPSSPQNMTLWRAVIAALAALLEFFRRTKKEEL